MECDGISERCLFLPTSSRIVFASPENAAAEVIAAAVTRMVSKLHVTIIENCHEVWFLSYYSPFNGVLTV